MSQNNYQFPIAFFDPPQVLSASVTSIPGSGSAPLQVVADLGPNSCTEVAFIDSTGDYIGLYIGAVGFETLRCIIGGGLNTEVKAFLPAHCRVSLRSMTASAITNGKITCTFLSY